MHLIMVNKRGVHMKSLNSGYKLLVIAAGATALLAFFQNCSPARFTTDSIVASERAQGDDGQIAGPQPGDDGNIPGDVPGDDGQIPPKKNPPKGNPPGTPPGDDGSTPDTNMCEARYTEVVGSHTPKSLCAAATTVRFIAGQHFYVGDVSIAIKQGYLQVQISMMGNVVMNESHVDIANSPSELQVSPGQFKYQQNHSPAASEYVYQIPLAGLSAGQTIYARVHAAVGPGKDSMLCSSETAWGEGIRSGIGWSMHIPVTLGECN